MMAVHLVDSLATSLVALRVCRTVAPRDASMAVCLAAGKEV